MITGLPGAERSPRSPFRYPGRCVITLGRRPDADRNSSTRSANTSARRTSPDLAERRAVSHGGQALRS